MGAIAGIIYPDRFQVTHIIDTMLKTLQHRGLKEAKALSYLNVEVGARGDKGSESFATHSKLNLVVGIDGEIANKEQVVHSFKKKGFQMDAQTPAELLLQAYAATRSLQFLEELDGDFAFFILDRQQEELILVRDRLGKKPLYWYHDAHHFIFASELKALLTTGYVPQDPSEDALAHYLFFGYLPQDMTPLKGVNKLLPGYKLRIKFNQAKSINPYWSLSSLFETQVPLDTSDIAFTLDQLLTKAVRLRLENKEKPIGCLISGGLGSTSCAYYATKVFGASQVVGYTTTFQGQNDADLIAAKEVANTLQIPHHSLALTPKDFFTDYPLIAWHLDEPLADPNVVATWHLAKLAKKEGFHVISGMGSDELLAAHNRYLLQTTSTSHLSFWLQEHLKPLKKKFLVPLLRRFWPKQAFHILRSYPSNPWQVAYLQQNALYLEEQHAQIAPSLNGLFNIAVFLNRFHNIYRIRNTVSAFLYFDVKTRLTDCFIHQYDRLTAAHSLNWQAPFLGKEIVSYLVALSEIRQANPSPSPLISILEKVFPSSVVDRPKISRPTFLNSWLAHPEVAMQFKNLYEKSALVEMGLISKKWLKDLVFNERPTAPQFRYLFSILSLEVWFRLYINRPLSESPPSCSLSELLLE